MDDESSESSDSKKDVYFIGCLNKKQVKIGVSHTPEQRLSDIQTNSSETLYIIEVVEEAGEAIESKLHEVVEPEHTRGEWFSIADDAAKDMARWARMNRRKLEDDLEVTAPPGWGTIMEVAQDWDVSERTIYRWRKEGKVLENRFGNTKYYRHVNRFLFSSSKTAFDDIEEEIKAYTSQRDYDRVMRDVNIRKGQLKNLKTYCIQKGYTIDQVIEFAIDRILPKNMADILEDA